MVSGGRRSCAPTIGELSLIPTFRACYDFGLGGAPQVLASSSRRREDRGPVQGTPDRRKLRGLLLDVDCFSMSTARLDEAGWASVVSHDAHTPRKRNLRNSERTSRLSHDHVAHATPSHRLKIKLEISDSCVVMGLPGSTVTRRYRHMFDSAGVTCGRHGLNVFTSATPGCPASAPAAASHRCQAGHAPRAGAGRCRGDRAAVCDGAGRARGAGGEFGAGRGRAAAGRQPRRAGERQRVLPGRGDGRRRPGCAGRRRAGVRRGAAADVRGAAGHVAGLGDRDRRDGPAARSRGQRAASGRGAGGGQVRAVGRRAVARRYGRRPGRNWGWRCSRSSRGR